MSEPLVLTGATGFVGRRLLARLRSEGYRVRALVRDPSALADEPGVESVPWRPGQADPEALRGAQRVCHLAAWIPADLRDPRHAEETLQVNALGTLDLLRAAQTAGVRRFVYMSSGNIYVPSTEPVAEGAPIWPTAAPFYLSSKALADLYVAQADAAGWLQGVSLRPSAIYGPGMKGGVVRSFVDRLRRGESITLQDGGRHRVDLVSVDDVVEGTLAALEHPVSGPFNLGSGRSTSISELAHLLAERLGVPPERIHVEPPSNAPPTGFATLDIRRAQRLLGYDPRSPAEGLASWLSG